MAVWPPPVHHGEYRGRDPPVKRHLPFAGTIGHNGPALDDRRGKRGAMRYRLTDEGGAIVKAFEGDIDLECSAEVRALLLDCVSREPVVVVDMSGVAVIDSSGVATFLEAYQGARKKEGTFVLAAVGETVLRVLKLARLDGVFTLADSVAEGLHARD